MNDLPVARRADGRFAYAHGEPDWDKVRAEYEGNKDKVADIAIRHRLGASGLYREARKRGWTLRKERQATPARLAQGVLELVDRQMADLATLDSDFDQEHAVTLGLLTNALHKASGLRRHENKKNGHKKNKRGDDPHVKAIRAQIARRLSENEHG